ncbi:uncharacterized protein (DUF885 family) [Pelomonas saccharophila]|uniref:Uncharacterized protein (DUF885 family) n=1 Tax=Roseateles saccharophilus TaxID=304 RepID=A0ABU1YKG6_ROSSA|nr:DUF885 domain-containing protein [Roseateles saccharophilus]MDR7269355.1 uncharacterized protein (DUF885 family) [Roseateles saccharophilus]
MRARWIAALLFAAALPAAAANAHLATLAERYYDGYYALFPVEATENTGDPRFEARLEIDIAPAHRQRQRAFYNATLRELDAIDTRALTPDEGTTRALLAYEARSRLALLRFPSHLLPLQQMDSLPSQLAEYASGNAAQPLQTLAQHEHFLQRLQGLPAWVDQAIVNMRQGLARGITQPRPIMERVLRQLEALAAAEANPFLQAAARLPDAGPESERLRARYARTVKEQIRPALLRLRAFVAESYLPRCRDTAGLSDLPDGAAWYRALVRARTTTDLSVADIHALGLREVARIQREIAAVQAEFGDIRSQSDFLAHVGERPELRPFKTEAEVLAAYAALNRDIETRLPRLFHHAPKARLEIRPVDPLRAATASDAYTPPAQDGSRPGVFNVVVLKAADYPTPGMASLLLHEGQPGHHYQMASQQELDLPRFRRFLWYGAYGEGWGLYAESLGGELGVYGDRAARLGRLTNELHRAVRLVLDTGLHAMGWTREQGLRYEREVEGYDEAEARRYVERYMAWPAQALAYKIGELRILALREKARTALGPRFDMRDFHAQVLDAGALPLSLLERRIDDWLKESRP